MHPTLHPASQIRTTPFVISRTALRSRGDSAGRGLATDMSVNGDGTTATPPVSQMIITAPGSFLTSKPVERLETGFVGSLSMRRRHRAMRQTSESPGLAPSASRPSLGSVVCAFAASLPNTAIL